MKDLRSVVDELIFALELFLRELVLETKEDQANSSPAVGIVIPLRKLAKEQKGDVAMFRMLIAAFRSNWLQRSFDKLKTTEETGSSPMQSELQLQAIFKIKKFDSELKEAGVNTEQFSALKTHVLRLAEELAGESMRFT